MPSAADSPRRLRAWAMVLLAELALGGVLAIGARLEAPGAEEAALRELASALELSSLALGSGAGYTRHPAQADRSAPWSDHPGALEHLPAGSLIPPPAALRERAAQRARARSEAEP